MTSESPVHPLKRLSEKLGRQILVKRDDLLPISGSGNKFRKNEAVFAELPNEVAAVITNGAVDSNHCRVVALMAATKGLRCHLVLHATSQEGRTPANLRLAALAGATFDIGPASTIAERLDRARERLMRELAVHVIPGGAHCPQGAQSYLRAATATRQQIESLGLQIDAVVVASGTGTTQAGLVAGLPGVEVWGISVARPAERGGRAVEEALSWVTTDAAPAVRFLDEWVGSGYGRPTRRAMAAIELLGREEGLILDPTYTGKAMAGLIDLCATARIPAASNVLFWHTGGLLNFVDTEQPADYQRELRLCSKWGKGEKERGKG